MTDRRSAGAGQGDAGGVTVLGAGIAGLACALALARQGRPVRVVEQAARLAEVGAGIQIAPNGARVLDALGVDVPHIASEALHLVDGPSGRTLLRAPLGPGFRLVHRADLVGALAASASAAGVRLAAGRRVLAIRPGALVTDRGPIPAAGRIVGADGVHGAARAHVAPEHAPRFTGQVAWRALVPLAMPWPHEAQVHVGRGRHIVLYPLRDGLTLNVVAVEERAAWAAEGWSQRDDPANLRHAFRSFAEPVRALLQRVGTVYLWGLMDHGATARWHRDDVTLIGDAAHPTLPFLAQGANLALEDAWTLSRSLDDPEGWERRRRPRVERALEAAAANARRYHLAGPRRLAAHAALRLANRTAPGLPLRGYRWLYDHDATR
ncbi:FAD-dependent monooxygenase [Jannaschia sp. W003]|uniref:FAD-dependent monooxygenase n=1 Tax=Jannaschia sp. W003 TaxID=2867012 RepID=UPI0021A69CB5|nr:FAD-dependent monooxygenase [Jannaschia sp. W003]UWQ20616.1 FAD-dependent monooxygenase [Jannaschia sp. W003]